MFRIIRIPSGGQRTTQYDVAGPSDLAQHLTGLLPDFAAWLLDKTKPRPNRSTHALSRASIVGIGGSETPEHPVTLVAELESKDVDYRDAYSTSYSRITTATTRSVVRVHFFHAEISAASIFLLSQEEKASYRGFLTLRPSPFGIVGRTILSPPRDPRPIVLTYVDEYVYFFGQPLKVTGVPYMEQDYMFSRCAHTAMWMCHYSAFLRGEVGRRTISEFSRPKTSTSRLYHDTLPAEAVSVADIGDVLAEFGLPQAHYDLETITSPRHQVDIPPWITQRLPQGLAETPTDGVVNSDDASVASEAEILHWKSRVLSRTIVRYLNSGFPCIAATRDHALVLVGWNRVERDGMTQTDFIVHDDQQGPYLNLVDPIGCRHCLRCGKDWGVPREHHCENKVSRQDLLKTDHAACIVRNDPRWFQLIRETERIEEARGGAIEPSDEEIDLQLSTQALNDALEQPDVVELSHGFESLIAPIPARLWLRAPHAEMYGGLFLFEKTQQLLEDDILHRDFLHCFKTGDVTFRSYALKSDVYKATLLDRGFGESLTSMIRPVPMPEWIWVVEAISRARRNAFWSGAATESYRPAKMVYGGVVLAGDASDHTLMSAEGSGGNIMWHLPGIFRQSGKSICRMDCGDTMALYEAGFGPGRIVRSPAAAHLPQEPSTQASDSQDSGLM